MIRVALFAALLLLAGCGFTTTGDAIRAQAVEGGAQAMDEGLANTEWFICNGASVGSVMRRYGSSPARAEAWKTLCQRDPAADLFPTPSDD